MILRLVCVAWPQWLRHKAALWPTFSRKAGGQEITWVCQRWARGSPGKGLHRGNPQIFFDAQNILTVVTHIGVGVRKLRNNIYSASRLLSWINLIIFFAWPCERLATVKYLDQHFVAVLHNELHLDITVVVIVVSMNHNIGAGLCDDQLQFKKDLGIWSEPLQEKDSLAGKTATFMDTGFRVECFSHLSYLLRVTIRMRAFISRSGIWKRIGHGLLCNLVQVIMGIDVCLKKSWNRLNTKTSLQFVFTDLWLLVSDLQWVQKTFFTRIYQGPFPGFLSKPSL